MKISASILDIKEPKNLEVEKLSSLDVDLIHIDVMDGVFVENTTCDSTEYYNIVRNSKKPFDIHLMVSNVKKFIDEYSIFNPEYITFHYEAVSDLNSVVGYIRDKNIKVGLSIKPSTDVKEIVEFLPYIDLILVMSVEPGRGGQSFIKESEFKLEQLKILREQKNYNYVIEVDGGVNFETIDMCKCADICVVGSYITKNNYEEQIANLRGKINE